MPLADKLFTLLKKRKLEVVWELEQRAKPLFLEMCYRDIPFDKERWDGLLDELEEKVLELKECADALAPPHPEGKIWNWFSSKQAIEAFELAGLKVPNLKRETLCRYDEPLVKASRSIVTRRMSCRGRTPGTRVATRTVGFTRSGIPPER
jgi:hypothetical protein